MQHTAAQRSRLPHTLQHTATHRNNGTCPRGKVLQCTALYCSVLRHVAACCSVLQCTAVYCGVLQCVAHTSSSTGTCLRTIASASNVTCSTNRRTCSLPPRPAQYTTTHTRRIISIEKWALSAVATAIACVFVRA